MSFMEEMVGFEERFAEMINYMCVLIGGVFAIFALVSSVGALDRALSYAAVAVAFQLFPLSAGKVFHQECCSKTPPPIVKSRRKR